MRKRPKSKEVTDARDRPRMDFEIELTCQKCDEVVWLTFWDQQEYQEHREGLSCWVCEGGNLYPTEKKRLTREDLFGAVREDINGS